MQRFDGAVRLRTAGPDSGRVGVEPLDRLLEAAAELAAVVGQHALEFPAGGLQLGCDSLRELRGLGWAGLSLRAGDELGPGIGGADVDRGQLPDGLLHVVQSPDEEAVEANQLAGPLRLHMAGFGGRARGLVGRGVTCDQREPLRARVQPVPAQAAPNAVGRNDEATPAWARELGRDPARTQTGMAQREGEDALLNERRELIGHPRPAPLARPQGPQPLPLDLPLPNVIGRTVHTEGTAGGTDSDSSGKVDQLQPVAEERHHATRDSTPFTWR